MNSILSILLITLIISSSDACIHDKLDIQLSELPPEDTPHDDRLLAGPQPIRIMVEYSTLTGTTTANKNYIQNQLMPAAVAYIRSALSVTPITTLKVSSTTTTVCGLPIPSKYRTGVQADLVLLVTAEATNDNYIAWARPCLLSGTNKRTVFGQIQFNLNYMVPGTSIDFESDVITTIHELTHVLGLTSSLFSYFPTNPTVASTVVNGNTVTYIDLPPLTKRLRAHFNCSTLKGAYLENQGSSGSAGSHFERRVFGNEYMTASAINDARISEFTLAFLEGTGWYTANYSMAEPFFWGKNKGCSFVNGFCVYKTTFKANFDEFCSPLTSKGCTFHGRSGGYCATTSPAASSSLDPDMNYWKNNTALPDTFADNCPYYRAYSNVDCEDPADAKRAILSAEVYGTGSKCFMGTLYPTGTLSSKTAFCLKYNCVKQSNGKYYLNVLFGSKTAVCTAKGSISVSGYYGKLDCPDPQEYCTTIGVRYCKRGCFGRGSCNTSTGICKCNAGFKGDDCSLPA